MPRVKLFFGFFFFLIGCGLAIILVAMSFDGDVVVSSESMMLWMGAISVFSMLVGVFMLSRE